MVRTRLASLTLAGAVLLTSSGCFNLFERFQCWRANHGARQDCACQDGGIQETIPTSIETPISGPILVNPNVVPPGSPQPPVGPPPRIVPVPAQPMPWPGAN